MFRGTKWVLAVGFSFVAVVVSVVTILATPATGFRGSTLSMGRFGSFDVFNRTPPGPQIVNPSGGRPGQGPWLSWQRAMGDSDLYVQSNVWDPGGTTGWHSHPGHSLITVTAGTVTVYEADDPSCTPHEYSAGMGFVDEGGDHVHVIRNEGSVEARTIAVQLVPAGATRRIDAEGNPNCPF